MVIKVKWVKKIIVKTMVLVNTLKWHNVRVNETIIVLVKFCWKLRTEKNMYILVFKMKKNVNNE